jgi:hypothetical protein
MGNQGDQKLWQPGRKVLANTSTGTWEIRNCGNLREMQVHGQPGRSTGVEAVGAGGFIRQQRGGVAVSTADLVLPQLTRTGRSCGCSTRNGGRAGYKSTRSIVKEKGGESARNLLSACRLICLGRETGDVMM